MSKEKLRIVYKPVELVTLEQARRLGITTDKPTFLGREYRMNRSSAPSLVYEVGSTVEAQAHQQSAEGTKGIFAFPELKTALLYESISYAGYAPYTGFIAVGEVMGKSVTRPIGRSLSELCTRAEKIRVLAIKAFVEESEVKAGYIEEFPDPYHPPSYLTISPKEGRLLYHSVGRLRYAFNITQSGEAVFSIPTGSEFIGTVGGEKYGV